MKQTPCPWESWAQRDFTDALCRSLAPLLRSSDESSDVEASEDEASDIVESLSEDALYELFEALRERSNVYWESQSSPDQYIDCERIADALSSEDLPLG
jgi:adenosine deaminase